VILRLFLLRGKLSFIHLQEFPLESTFCFRRNTCPVALPIRKLGEGWHFWLHFLYRVLSHFISLASSRHLGVRRHASEEAEASDWHVRKGPGLPGQTYGFSMFGMGIKEQTPLNRYHNAIP